MVVVRWFPLLTAVITVNGCGDNVPVLDQERIWTLNGGVCFGLAGTAVGDLDGDGIDDLVIATPNCKVLGVPGAPDAQLAVYRGTRGGFDPQPIVHIYDTIDHSAAFDVDIGDIDGDGRGDLTMTTFGVSDLFLGTSNLEHLFDNRYPGPGGPGVFFNTDGDDDDEFLGTDGATVTVLDWQGDALTSRATFPGDSLARGGDTNGDGIDDVYVRTQDTIQLYRGCKKSQCENGMPEGPHGVPIDALPIAVGDVNGDHKGDAVVLSAAQELTLHLADEHGVLRETPEWKLRPDLLYGPFSAVQALGDVNGDGRSGDLGVSQAGRTMVLFAEKDGPSAQPGWEWSLGNASDADFTYEELSALTHRDFDGDGYSDVVMFRVEGGSRNLVAYHGGVVPIRTVAPTLPTDQVCNLREDATQPDLTVDNDLVARSLRLRTAEFAPDACELTEMCVGAPGARRLLEFSVSIQNFGGAPALLPTPQRDPSLYAYDACHRHDHLIGFADYALLDPDGELRVAGHKQGFYPIDYGAYCDRGPIDPVDIQLTEFLYISPGWADIYSAGLQCQWIDVTDIPDGDYRLRVRVNVSGVITEDDQLPDEVEVPITIAGEHVSVNL